MEFDRNRYFMIGILLFLLGIQFRSIESFVLNEPSTRMLARFTHGSQVASASDFGTSVYLNVHPSPKKQMKPPTWLGWVLLTSGGVMALHALMLPKSNK